MTVHSKSADPWPEAGWWCLPFKIASPQFRLSRLGGVVNPATDLVPGSNHELFALNGGLSVASAGGHGVGLCSLDAPLISLGRPGCWRYTTHWQHRDAVVYVNLFNNQWTTNFRFWNEGTWTYRVRLWPVDRRDSIRDSLVVPSLEARWPLRGAMVDGVAGRLPSTQAGVVVSEPGVLVTSFGPASMNREIDPLESGTPPSQPSLDSESDDGSPAAWFGPREVLRLRFWDQTGGEGGRRSLQVQLPRGLESAERRRTDLRGQEDGPVVRRSGRSFRFEREPWAPATFEFRRPSNPSTP